MIPYIPHITITKLRMGIQYEQTCSQPMDSFYELYEQWMVSRPELNFHGYNFTFDGYFFLLYCTNIGRSVNILFF